MSRVGMFDAMEEGRDVMGLIAQCALEQWWVGW
jgi:hypothetical protein